LRTRPSSACTADIPSIRATRIVFDPDDNFDFGLGSLGELTPGEDGAMFGIEVGRPLSPAFDVQASLTGFVFSEDEAENDADGASASNRFDYEYLDLELGYRPGVVKESLRIFGGPRLLHAGNDIDYDLDGTSGKVGSYDRDIDLWGGGLRLGAETMMPLGNSRASLSLMGAGSALLAHADHRYSFDFISNFDEGAGEDSDDDWRGVYNLEALAAVNFAVTDRVNLQLGYQVQHWWNLTTTVGDVDSGDESIEETDNGKGDFLEHGPMARVTIELP
jgi:hypothetical protein